MRQLILDYKKWRCGGGDVKCNNGMQLGSGGTALYNGNTTHSFCCLGMWSMQLSDVKPSNILGRATPSRLELKIPLLTSGKFNSNSAFSKRAVTINDDPNTTIQKKIEKLQKLCGKYNYDLIVKNLPKKYQK